jgi:hypothetical protein
MIGDCLRKGAKGGVVAVLGDNFGLDQEACLSYGPLGIRNKYQQF